MHAINAIEHSSDVRFHSCRLTNHPPANCPATHTADLLKRHAERHIKREASGYSSLPTPGRIKGAPSKKRSITDLAAGTEQSISDNNAGPSTRRPPKAQRPFGVQQQNVQSTISSAATSAVDPQSLPMSAASSFGPPLDETLEEPSFEALMNTTASSLAYSHDREYTDPTLRIANFRYQMSTACSLRKDLDQCHPRAQACS